MERKTQGMENARNGKRKEWKRKEWKRKEWKRKERKTQGMKTQGTENARNENARNENVRNGKCKEWKRKERKTQGERVAKTDLSSLKNALIFCLEKCFFKKGSFARKHGNDAQFPYPHHWFKPYPRLPESFVVSYSVTQLLCIYDPISAFIQNISIIYVCPHTLFHDYFPMNLLKLWNVDFDLGF